VDSIRINFCIRIQKAVWIWFSESERENEGKSKQNEFALWRKKDGEKKIAKL